MSTWKRWWLATFVRRSKYVELEKNYYGLQELYDELQQSYYQVRDERDATRLRVERETMDTQQPTTLDVTLLILAINTHIQRGLGTLYLSGKEVLCVALDRSCAFTELATPNIQLTDSQLLDLANQALGAPPATLPALPKAQTESEET